MTYQELVNYYSKKASDLNKEKSAVLNIIKGLANYSTSDLYLNYDKEVPNLENVESKINLYLEENIPSQYVLGYTYFYNNKIIVNQKVLIPRFETEILVDEVLKYIPVDAKYKILDIGTGSGSIAIAIKKERSNSLVHAVDISLEALAVAKKNAIMNSVEIVLKESDIFSNVSDTFDVIVSNPPYIAFNDEVEDIVLKEPSLALYASMNGLYFYHKILEEAKNKIYNKALIAFEIGASQGKAVCDIAKRNFPECRVLIKKDLSKKDRVVLIYIDKR